MLEVQKFLHHHKSFDELTNQFGIKVNHHPEDERVILNYCQIESAHHKTHPVVRDCRGLVLSSKDYSVIARAFPRFFNLGEVEIDFDWEDYVCQEKADGSLILLYHWNGDWHVNTRNSFGSAKVGESEFTWRDLVSYSLPFFWKDKLDKRFTYIFELCSPYNQVVKRHDNTHVKLLSIYEKYEGKTFEVAPNDLRYLATNLKLDLVEEYKVEGKDIEPILERIESEDPTNEGIVLRDCNNNRLKVKTKSYLRLHRAFMNGNLASTKNLVPVIMNHEIDELLAYWPFLQEKVDKIRAKLDEYRQSLDNYWFVHGDESNRKKFALAVKEHPFSSLLFKAKDTGENPVDLFEKSEELIIKILDRQGL